MTFLLKHKLLLILSGIIFCQHSIAVAETKPDESPPSLEELQKQAPADVVKFIDQAFACLHWGGEYSGDPARQAQIQREWKKSCSPLKRKEAQLKAKYRNHPKVLHLIQETKKQVEY